jgi:hypothetical protein
MRMISKDFELHRTEFCDTLTFKKTSMRITLAPGELEDLFRFLGPLYEDIFLGDARDAMK